MKYPKWFDDSPKIVAHPNATLKQAANVLKADAAEHRRAGNKEAANALAAAADALKCVSEGESWRSAFHLGDDVKPESNK